MNMTSPAWDRYARWNAAIAQVVYPPRIAGSPAYLDLEDDVLQAIAQIAEPGAPDPAAGLIAAVRTTLRFDQGPSRVLAEHLQNVETWSAGSMVDPPPVLALLA